ncbi:threonine--tRNA ligase, cytoplasmic isoform X2 [Formica exsecta]|uniref:threonine--tRNA ligase, cytoplasmic isoform X2 n=1 Tax=Formica exsecta TaxID=72781 RepID=UPI00114374C8|nr:threonine--tRNA ligase, cytoplasmic isoform X2 [Formica exsecta]
MSDNVVADVQNLTLTEDKTKAMKAYKKKNAVVEKSISELNPWPSYIQDRIILWDKLKKEYEDELATKTPVDITVTLPDGKKVSAQSWRTTPYEVARSISQGLADNTVIAKVNNELWDLDRPLEYDCKLQLLKFDDPEGRQVFWHSSAHILGEAMERVYGGCLCYGPPIENGFYYDMYLGDKGISNTDFPYLENLYKSIAKEKQTFERLVMTKEDLLEMFKYNEFKVRIINEKIHTPTTTVYRCGPLIDLCRGPHVRHTGKIKALKVTKNSSTYWEGNANAESLQRVYGISFPDAKQLKEWEKFQEEAAKRDHRKIGKEQELFFFHELSPGSCFFQPRGAYIYNTLVEFIRSEYRKRGFQEVISPNIYNSKLWQTSGHWQHYAENMFCFDVEKETFALKPMNCPGHCMIFDVRCRSWRELPLRMADFGVLHRNELSGALTGLTRVRRFQQDDAHIFCSIDQIKDEMLGALDFLRHVYSIFGFTFNLCLSTRPEKYLGDLEVWDRAEKALEDSLNAFGQPWTLNPQDGAFYGPKIDITLMDALKRAHQTATIQLDFQLPIRFNLSYVNEAGEKTRPVIIHRAILGSVERMVAILTESYGGKWPYWLSPRQAMVVPVVSQFDDYAYEVKQKLWDAGVMVEVDTDSSDTLNKKIRNAQLAQFNFILVVGEKERNAGTVNIRTRDNVVHGEMAVEELITKLKIMKETRDLSGELKS